MARMQQHLQTVVTAEEAGRVDLVVQRLTKLPRRQVRGVFDHNAVMVNGTVCTEPFTRVAAGDKVEVNLDPHRRYAEKPRAWRDPTFRIVQEDEHLIVIDKASAALTVPARPGQTNTLIHRVGEYLTARGGGGKRKRAYICHRLDRGVSGLLVIAKSEAVQEQIRDQFELRKPHRRYTAIVRGKLAKKQGTFRSHLATGNDLTRYSVGNPEHGELAITHYRVEQELDDATVVSVELETGRRNQIRVHFAEAKHPVLGDPRYESKLANHRRWRVKRLALHAAELGFTHPVTNEQMKFTSALPGVFDLFIGGAVVTPRPGGRS